MIVMRTYQGLLRKITKNKRKEEEMELFLLKILINSTHHVKHNNLIYKTVEVLFTQQLQCDKAYLTIQQKSLVRIVNLKINQKF